MKKSQLREIILETIKEVGYTRNPDTGELESTQGGTTDDFRKILTRIAKQGVEREDSEEARAKRGANFLDKYGDAKKGNDILDKGNPNIPLDEANGITYSKDDLIWYLDRLDPNTRVTIPSISQGGFSVSQGTQYTAGAAIQALEKTKLDGKFELYMDNPTFKRFSLVQSPQATKDHEALVRSMMASKK